jgi:hypothetical protein
MRSVGEGRFVSFCEPTKMCAGYELKVRGNLITIAASNTALVNLT